MKRKKKGETLPPRGGEKRGKARARVCGPPRGKRKGFWLPIRREKGGKIDDAKRRRGTSCIHRGEKENLKISSIIAVVKKRKYAPSFKEGKGW